MIFMPLSVQMISLKVNSATSLKHNNPKNSIKTHQIVRRRGNEIFGVIKFEKDRSISGEIIFRWTDGFPKKRFAPSKARVTDKEVHGEGT